MEWYSNQGSKSVTVAVKEQKNGLTLAKVHAVMNTSLLKTLLLVPTGDLVVAQEAQIRQLALPN
ncbi:DUF2922 family protein [Anaerospora hongkongensis]|uniref:DUF2922 family protein n=1 Tax=Anaerospora hongkongensis TaxID=244830 RepID=UPI002436D478|nr:DUF2922 family protein [Anaerospora hongkongensis]